MTNTLEPAVLGHKLLQLAPEHKNAALGFTTFIGLVLAAGWQPIVGAFSDRTRSPWGRRVPYFLGGTVFLAISLLAVAFGPTLLVVVVGLLSAQLSMNTVLSPWQALVPDQVPIYQRGAASGLKAAFDVLSFILGRQISGQLVARGEVGAAVGAALAMFLAALLFTILSSREPIQGRPTMHVARIGWRQSLLSFFRVDRKAHPEFGWWFLNRFLSWFGFVALNTFILFYLIDVVRMQEAEAHRFVANLSAVLGLALLVVVIPSGWLTDRIGRRPLLLSSGPIALAGTGVLLFAREPASFIAAGVLLGLAAGTFLSANWALVTDIVPMAEAARYLGIANLAGAGGSALARLMGGALIDPVSRLAGDPFWGYAALYSMAALGFVLGTAAGARLPAGRAARES